ncbi:MAG TPA: sugar phosphate isomerase/epimerase family protein [Pirellulales bacterium]|jgi:sugar phosphate isomerase/epimerase|nr:sugar phosphate isomerase/epimerase family protein [Pirellulales bacterium]
MLTPWSRRKFLGVAAGAAAAVGTRSIARAASEPSNKYGGFNLGLQSYTLRSFKVDQALEEIKNLGLHSVEFTDGHFSVKSSDADVEAMKSKTQALGIKIMGHGVNPFTKDHDANRRWFEFAKKAGIRNLSADPTEDAFDSLDKLCEEYKIRIAIHNHGPYARYNKVTDVLTAIKGHHPLIGACADLGHYIRSAEDPVRVVNLLEGRLFGVHLKDFAEQKAKTKGVILGQGHLDVEGVFRALRKVNFPADGCLSLEYEENPQDPLADVKQCLAVASEAALKAAG